jgi:citrate lyase subunit beta/citryl-CoA lyase
LSQVLLAARRHGRLAIDSVYFRYHDDAGLRVHAALARELGYDGKCCIHPSQVRSSTRFTQHPEECGWAERVLRRGRKAEGAPPESSRWTAK